MDNKIEQLITEHPNLVYILKNPRFLAMSEEKKANVLEVIEDAIFWFDLEGQGSDDGGFKFLASTFGLNKAQKDVAEKGLIGKEREQYLQPHQELYTQYNPYSGRTSDDRD